MADFEKNYKIAFGIIMSQVTGIDRLPVNSIFNALVSFSGDIKKQTTAILEYFRGIDWRWPEYESFARKQVQIGIEEKKKNIFNKSVTELLNNIDMKKLKLLYEKCSTGKNNSKRRKAEIIHEIEKNITCDQISSLRYILIENVQTAEGIARDRIAEMLVRQIETMAHSLHDREGLIECRDILPYWELVVTDIAFASDVCKSMAGNIIHYSDQRWKINSPPCYNFDCTCYIRPYTEHEYLEIRKMQNQEG